MIRTSQIQYGPATADVAARCESTVPETVLVVGMPGDDLAAVLAHTATNARWCRSPFSKHVPAGTYSLRREQRWHLLVVLDGAPAASARTDELRHIEADDPLALANELYESNWGRADTLGRTPAFGTGAMVRLGSNRIGRVVDCRRVRDTFRYTVIIDGEPLELFEDDLKLEDGDPRRPGFWLRQPVAEANEIALTLTWTKLRHPLSDVLSPTGRVAVSLIAPPDEIRAWVCAHRRES